MSVALERPQLLEATAPPERRGIARDGVRMLVTDRSSGSQTHAHFDDLPSVLRPGNLLIANDSATLPAAISARRANGDAISLHLATMIDRRIWMVEPRGTVVVGEEFALPDGGSAVTIAPVDPERPRVWYAWFQTPAPMHEYLMRVGEPIRYGYVTERFPLDDYQTMFARVPGSSEMPSAARPFTPRVVRMLAQRGVDIATVTLHCGVASFENPERPISERFVVPNETAEAINVARYEGRRVIAIGTTVVRALESGLNNGAVVASMGMTDLVIDEHHRIRSVDGLLSGFHDASATHVWMLRAFLSPDVLDDAYAEAAEHGYYRHEFGDVHLIL